MGGFVREKAPPPRGTPIEQLTAYGLRIRLGSMDSRLAQALLTIPEPYQTYLRLIALTESGGDPDAYNPGGGGSGAVGAWQMRKAAAADQGYSLDAIRGNVSRQLDAAYRHLTAVVIPAIKRAGRDVSIETVGQAWHDGPGTLTRPPSSLAMDWIARARRWAGTSVPSIASGAVYQIRESHATPWIAIGAGIALAGIAYYLLTRRDR